MSQINKLNFNPFKKTFSRTSMSTRETHKPKPSGRSMVPRDTNTQRQRGGIILPMYPTSFQDLKRMAIAEPTTRTCTIKLNQEVFRKPPNIEPKYWGKCEKCDYEYEHKPSSIQIDEFEMLKNGFSPCPACKEEGGTIRPPDPQEKTRLKKWIKRVDFNDKRLVDVCQQLEYDMNTLDDYYLIQFKDYVWNSKTKKLIGKTHKVSRGDPELIRISADERQNIGTAEWTCFFHRDRKFDSPSNFCDGNHDFDIPLQPVHFAATEFGGKQVEICYIKDEVIHNNKYFKSPLYGMPPMLTLYRTQFLHIMMIDYMYLYYKEKKIPTGMLTMPEGDPDALEEQVEAWKNRLLDDPNFIPVFAVDPDAKHKPEFIRFFDKLTEMELKELRAEIKEVIGAFYGVMPILLADTSSGSGLNNEGLQFTVTNRATEYAQNEYNHFIFPRMLEGLLINDWKIMLPPSEEQDQMAILQRQAQALMNMRDALEIDLDVEIIPDEIDGIKAQYSGKPKKISLLGDALNTLWDDDQQGDIKSKNPEKQDTKGKPKIQSSKKEKAPDQKQPPNKSSPKQVQEHAKGANPYSLIIQDSIQKLGMVEMEKQGGVITQALKEKISKIVRLARPELEKDYVQGMLGLMTAFVLTQVVRHVSNQTQFSINYEKEEEKELLLDSIEDFDEALFHRFQNLSQDFFRETYSMGSESVKMKGADIGLNIETEEIMSAFIQQKQFLEALKGLSQDTSVKMREIVMDSYKAGRPTRTQLVQKFKHVVNLEEPRLRTIARTESQRFFLIGRELAYERVENAHGEKFKYIWRVRHDNRTSDLCKEIESLVPSDGLTLKQLKELVYYVQKHGENKMPSYWKPSWTPHPNCRSRMVRKQ